MGGQDVGAFFSAPGGGAQETSPDPSAVVSVPMWGRFTGEFPEVPDAALAEGARAVVRLAMATSNTDREGLDLRVVVSVRATAPGAVEQYEEIAAGLRIGIPRLLTRTLDADYPVDRFSDRPADWPLTFTRESLSGDVHGQWRLEVHHSPRRTFASYRAQPVLTMRTVGNEIVSAADRRRIALMAEGFTDAMVRVGDRRLPRFTVTVHLLEKVNDHAAPARSALFSGIVGEAVRGRLSQYPAGSTTVTVDDVMAQAKVMTPTHDSHSDPVMGLIEVKVEGQRQETGSFGPESFVDPRAGGLQDNREAGERVAESYSRSAEREPVGVVVTAGTPLTRLADASVLSVVSAKASAGRLEELREVARLVMASNGRPPVVLGRADQLRRDAYDQVVALVSWRLYQLERGLLGPEHDNAADLARDLMAEAGFVSPRGQARGPLPGRLPGGAGSTVTAGSSAMASSSTQPPPPLVTINEYLGAGRVAGGAALRDPAIGAVDWSRPMYTAFLGGLAGQGPNEAGHAYYVFLRAAGPDSVMAHGGVVDAKFAADAVRALPGFPADPGVEIRLVAHDTGAQAMVARFAGLLRGTGPHRHVTAAVLPADPVSVAVSTPRHSDFHVVSAQVIEHGRGAFRLTSDDAEVAGWPRRLMSSVIATALPHPSLYVVLETDGQGVLSGAGVVSSADAAAAMLAQPSFSLADPDSTVWIVVHSRTTTRDGMRVAGEFAEALRGDGPYRRMDAVARVGDRNRRPVELAPAPADYGPATLPRPDDLRFSRIDTLDGQLRGLELSTNNFYAGPLSVTTVETLRVAFMSDLNGRDMTVPTPWLEALEPGRTPPIWLFLGPDLLTPLVGGVSLFLDTRQLAIRIVGNSQFRALTAGEVRSPLIIVQEQRLGGYTFAEHLADELLIQGDTREIHVLSMGMPLGRLPTGSMPVLRVGNGVRYRPMMLTRFGISVFGSGTVFGYPSTSDPAWSRQAMQQFADGVSNGSIRLAGQWGSRQPVIFVAPGAADSAVLVERFGMKGAFEVEGRWAAQEQLRDPRFSQLVRSSPLLILVPGSGDRVGFGGFGFDFVTALHEAGVFPEAYAQIGRDGLPGRTGAETPSFALVSGPRAGDLRLSLVRDPANEIRMVVVRVPGDDARFGQYTDWARGSSKVKDYDWVTLPDGTRTTTGWGSGTRPPVFVVAERTRTGYRGTRPDGSEAEHDASTLMRILRDDMNLRLALGRNPRENPSFVFATLGDGALEAPEIQRGLASGGYARTFYWSDGPFTFHADGTVAIGPVAPGGKAVNSVPPSAPSPAEVVSVSLSNAELGEFGRAFPSKDHDLVQGSAWAQTYRPDLGFANRYFLDGSSGEFYFSPYAGQRFWVVDGHGSVHGMLVSLKTGRPRQFGDMTMLGGRGAAALLLATVVFEGANQDRAPSLLFFQCDFNQRARGSALSLAQQILQAWNRMSPDRPIERMVAATGRVGVWTGSVRRPLETFDGGIFSRVVMPGEPVPAPIRPISLVVPRQRFSVTFRPGVDDVYRAQETKEAGEQIADALAWRQMRGTLIRPITIAGGGSHNMPIRSDEALVKARDRVAWVRDQVLDAIRARNEYLESFGLAVDVSALRFVLLPAVRRSHRGARPQEVLILPNLEVRKDEAAAARAGGQVWRDLLEADAGGGSPSQAAALPQPVVSHASKGVRGGTPPTGPSGGFGQSSSSASLPAVVSYPPEGSSRGGFAVVSRSVSLNDWPGHLHGWLGRGHWSGTRPAFVIIEAENGAARDETGVIDADTAGQRVRDSAGFKALERDTPIRVLVLDVNDDPRTTDFANRFGEVLRANAPLRPVLIAVVDQDPSLSRFRRPEHVHFSPLPAITADSLVSGPMRNSSGDLVGFDLSGERWLNSAKVMSRTVHAERVTDARASGQPFVTTAAGHPGYYVPLQWAGLTEPGRVRPVLIGMSASAPGHLTLSEGEGHPPFHLTPEETARILLGKPGFVAAITAPEQPTLVLLTRTAVNSAAVGQGLAAQVVTALSAATQRTFATIDVVGELAVNVDGVLRMRTANRIMYRPMPVGATSVFRSNSVFGFPSEKRGAGWSLATFQGFSDAVESGRLVVPGPWKHARPFFFVAPGEGIGGGRAGLVRDGEVDVSGAWAGTALLSDPHFRSALTTTPRRPLVIIKPHPSGEQTFGTFAFDLVTLLHRSGFYPTVYALKGFGDLTTVIDPSTTYSDVSELRAGDLKVSPVRDAAGTPRALVIRTPGDDAFFDSMNVWANASTDDSVRQPRLPDGTAVDASWRHERFTPVFVVLRPGSASYRGAAADGVTELDVTPRQLITVLRDDTNLRLVLGRGDAVAPGLTEPSVVFAPVDEPLLDPGDLAAGLAQGGYFRTTHWPDGTMQFKPDGSIVVNVPTFGSMPPRPITVSDVVSYPMVVRTHGLDGVVFPSQPHDLVTTMGDAAFRAEADRDFYFSKRKTLDSSGTEVELDVPMLSPAFGLQLWRTWAHGERTKVDAALPTSRPYSLGDIVGLGPEQVASFIVGHELFTQAHPNTTPPLILEMCLVGGPGPGSTAESFAHAIKRAFSSVAPHRDVPRMFASTEVMYFGRGHNYVIDNGGDLVEVVAPGAVVLPSVELTDLVANHIPPTSTRFGPSGARISPDSGAGIAQSARAVVRAAAWRQFQLPQEQWHTAMPSVVITGGGTGHAPKAPRGGPLLSIARTEKVRQRFDAEMRDEAEKMESRNMPVDVNAIRVVVRVPGRDTAYGVPQHEVLIETSLAARSDWDVVRSRDERAIRVLFRDRRGVVVGAAFPVRQNHT
ncbi:hypothetical protein [Lentzea sp. NPDC004782]|uniref:hypothetical protein n=1 Tax=Lentzea sp. NPDC004782 TaxID=3154458 RepID=UPI0033BD1B7E